MNPKYSHPDKVPAAPPPAVPRGRRRKEGYRYYLEDHPVLGPIITLVLGGLCLYLSVFTSTLQGWMAGPNADRSALANANTAVSWGLAFVIALMAMALMFLIWQVLESSIRRARRRPSVCPRCGTVEAPDGRRFAHQPVQGMSWETVTCPKCQHEWHSRL